MLDDRLCDLFECHWGCGDDVVCTDDCDEAMPDEIVDARTNYIECWDDCDWDEACMEASCAVEHQIYSDCFVDEWDEPTIGCDEFYGCTNICNFELEECRLNCTEETDCDELCEFPFEDCHYACEIEVTYEGSELWSELRACGFEKCGDAPDYGHLLACHEEECGAELAACQAD